MANTNPGGGGNSGIFIGGARSADGTSSGGGAGAGGNGSTGTNTAAGDGGIGIISTITGNITYYAGGGGGANSNNLIQGVGGLGGGGAGAYSGTATSGTALTGGGGGAGALSTSIGGSGGKGIVIVRYLGSQKATGGIVTSSGGYTIHTFTSTNQVFDNSWIAYTQLTSEAVITTTPGSLVSVVDLSTNSNTSIVIELPQYQGTSTQLTSSGVILGIPISYSLDFVSITSFNVPKVVLTGAPQVWIG